MATLATKPVTAEEFWHFVHRPENRGRRFELVEGEILEMPPPGKYHGFVCGNVSRLLGNFAQARRAGHVCTNDSGLVVEEAPDTVRGPDVSFFEDAQTADDMERGFAQNPPRLVVEVLSPHDRPNRLARRVEQYLDRGVLLVWVVDPEARDPASHRRGRALLLAAGEQEITGEDVLPGLRCRVAEFFALPGQ